MKNDERIKETLLTPPDMKTWNAWWKHVSEEEQKFILSKMKQEFETVANTRVIWSEEPGVVYVLLRDEIIEAMRILPQFMQDRIPK
jgi:hypothetical protein